MGVVGLCSYQAVNLIGTNTGEVIRTPALGVMSPARYLCATPVCFCLRVLELSLPGCEPHRD